MLFFRSWLFTALRAGKMCFSSFFFQSRPLMVTLGQGIFCGVVFVLKIMARDIFCWWYMSQFRCYFLPKSLSWYCQIFGLFLLLYSGGLYTLFCIVFFCSWMTRKKKCFLSIDFLSTMMTRFCFMFLFLLLVMFLVFVCVFKWDGGGRGLTLVLLLLLLLCLRCCFVLFSKISNILLVSLRFLQKQKSWLLFYSVPQFEKFCAWIRFFFYEIHLLCC